MISLRSQLWGEALKKSRALREDLQPLQDVDHWIKEAEERKRATLCEEHTSLRCLPTPNWIKALDPHESSLLQVGANIHEKTSYTQDDPAPLAVELGWSCTLLEPMPEVFEMLEKHYTPPPPNVKLINAAVCDECSDVPLTMYSIDLTNATGNWGSNTSDTRCFAANSGSESCMPFCNNGSHWTSEIASLTREHLVRHNRLFAYGPNQCRRCSQRLGRPMPSDCMREIITKNIKETSVHCFCIATDLASHADNLSLLMIDAEGHDDAVLEQFPFDHMKPARVIFEAFHLGLRRFYKIARYLRAYGYEMLDGSPTAYITTWHHVNSTEQ